MLKRHDVTPRGVKIDREWWHIVKISLIIAGALGAAYVVHVTLL